MWRFLYGLVLGVGGMALRNWMVAENITVGWYVWPLMLIALALGTLAVHNYFASLAELEPKAARMGLLFMGLPALLLSGVVTAFFV
jgi:hypothetical protein